MESNLNRHCIDAYLGCIRIDSYEIASNIEGILNTGLGLYIGKGEESFAGRGGNEDSTIVYLAKRNLSGVKDYTVVL